MRNSVALKLLYLWIKLWFGNLPSSRIIDLSALNNSNSEILSNGKLDLKSALRQLGKKGINTLLLEAGSGLNGAMLEAGLIDEYIIYTAPVILGSNASSMINIPLNKMSEKIELNILDIRQIGSDIKIRATLK